MACREHDLGVVAGAVGKQLHGVCGNAVGAADLGRCGIDGGAAEEILLTGVDDEKELREQIDIVKSFDGFHFNFLLNDDYVR